jgi:hypothetical protein
MKLLLVFCLFDKLDEWFDIGVWNEKWDFMMHCVLIDATVINGWGVALFGSWIGFSVISPRFLQISVSDELMRVF